MTTRAGSRRRTVAVACLAAVLGAAIATTGSAQVSSGWRVENDPFTDLWYHGLAVVGFDGFGRVPMYAPGYGREAAARWATSGAPASALEQIAGRLRASFQADPSFEVLHFVPLYFTDAPVDAALSALTALSGEGRDARVDARLRREADAIGAVLPRPAQREALAAFVEALRTDRGAWSRARPAPDVRAADIRRAWSSMAMGPINAFLIQEGYTGGTIVLTPALGLEGRFRADELGPRVIVGNAASAEATLGSVVRELCYPIVRRALAPWESRLDDRITLTDVGDQAATHCGALLLDAYAPGLLPAYANHFGIDAPQTAFLSAAGFAPGVAVNEQEMTSALLHELNLNLGSDRAPAWPAGR